MREQHELPKGYSVRFDKQTGWHWYNDVADIPSEAQYESEVAAVIGAWKDFSLNCRLDVDALVKTLERNGEPHLAEKIHYTTREEDDTRCWRMEDFSVPTNAYQPASFKNAMQAFLSGFLAPSKPVKPVAVTRGVLDKHHRFGRIEYLGDANAPRDGTEVYLAQPDTPEHSNHVIPDWLVRETFAIQHNPNCPSRYLVRLPGHKCGFIDMKSYYVDPPEGTKDALGFGNSLAEAAEKARDNQKEVGFKK